MSRNEDLQKRRDAAIARGIANQLPVFIERARNAELWDVEGRRYIDFASGIAVVNTGHVHPAVQAAAAKQLEAFTHTCFMVTPYEVAVELAERLNRLAPGPTPKKSIFVTTGAEAVENAIKIARAHTGRSGVIAFGGGFHGRTFMAMALTGKVAPYKAAFGPFPAEIYHAPFPIAYHGCQRRRQPGCDRAALQVRHRARARRGDHRRAGDGRGRLLHRAAGVPAGAAQALRPARHRARDRRDPDRIRAHRADVCGRVRGHRARPHDAGQESRGRISARRGRGQGVDHGCACAGRARRHLCRFAGGLCGGSRGAQGDRTGAAVRARGADGRRSWCRRLREAARTIPAIGEVRNLGAMVAMELVKNGDPHQPDADLTKALVKHAASKGLVILSCGIYGNVIRFLAPLTRRTRSCGRGWESWLLHCGS